MKRRAVGRIVLGVVTVGVLALAAPSWAHHRADHTGGPQPGNSTSAHPTEDPSEQPSDEPTAGPSEPPLYSPEQGCWERNDVPDNSGTGWGGLLQPASFAYGFTVTLVQEAMHDASCMI